MATYFVLNFLCSDFDVKKMSWWLHKVIWYASGIQQEASGQERRVRCLLCVQWWCADQDHDYLLLPIVIVLTESESIHSSLAYLMQRLKWVHCKWLYFMLLAPLAQKLLKHIFHHLNLNSPSRGSQYLHTWKILMQVVGALLPLARWCVVREQSTGLCNISQYPQKGLSFSLLKALTSAFTESKNLLRQHAKPEFKHGE